MMVSVEAGRQDTNSKPQGGAERKKMRNVRPLTESSVKALRELLRKYSSVEKADKVHITLSDPNPVFTFDTATSDDMGRFGVAVLIFLERARGYSYAGLDCVGKHRLDSWGFSFTWDPLTREATLSAKDLPMDSPFSDSE